MNCEGGLTLGSPWSPMSVSSSISLSVESDWSLFLVTSKSDADLFGG